MAKKHRPPAAARQKPVSIDHRPNRQDLINAALAAVGLLVTGYLSFGALTRTASAFCGSGSNCDLIQNSHWSTLFGMPVALWGFATYALILLFCLIPSTRMRRWRRVWMLSLIGIGVSIYLTVVGLIQLEATCGWCLASLTLMAALFVSSSLQRPKSGPGMPWTSWSMQSAVVLLGIVGIMHLAYAGLFSPRPEPRLQALAAHLSDSGAQFFGAFWCSSCQEQKAEFGGAADDLPYVECSPNGRGGPVALVCVDNRIVNFPTWIINGRRLESVLTAEELARYSAFKWPADDAP